MVWVQSNLYFDIATLLTGIRLGDRLVRVPRIDGIEPDGTSTEKCGKWSNGEFTLHYFRTRVLFFAAKSSYSRQTVFAMHLQKQFSTATAEYLMWHLIRNRQRCQAKLRRQHKLGPYILDFFFPDAKLVIECDGLPHFTPVGIKKDRILSQWLNPVGIEVIRFTSDEIENDTQGVLFAIDVVLKRLLKQDAPPHPPTPSPPEEEES